jgi:hypothetical protein
MKKFVTTLVFASVSTFTATLAHAGTVPVVCIQNAAKFVESAVDADKYDREGFEAFECRKANLGRIVICDVAAPKGGGEAMDTYRVVMNKTCTRTLRPVDLVGEE